MNVRTSHVEATPTQRFPISCLPIIIFFRITEHEFSLRVEQPSHRHV